VIHRLGELAGGAAGIAATMRATLSTAYDDLRVIAGFFDGPQSFFSFVSLQLNAELVPGVRTVVRRVSDHTLRVHYRINDELAGSKLYFEGTRTLIEVFPTHFGLPEARVEVASMTDRVCEVLAEFPAAGANEHTGWGRYLTPSHHRDAGALTEREQEVLHFVCGGFTNAEIATALGTAPSTVKSQISSILRKMDVANRTELAARVSPR
jgi:DNA-binding CsgD family transcriptional regulator